jgi:transcriptional regulator with XRE-family HTH domain
MSALSDLLVRANTAGLSARRIALLAKEAGYRINHDTAARYLRGDHGRPDEETLRAFASVLPVRLTELRAAVRLPAEETEPYRPPAEASRLNRRQRRAVDEIIRAMLEPPASAEVTELDSRRGAGSAGRRGNGGRRTGSASRRDTAAESGRDSGKVRPNPRAARRGGTEPPTK